MLSVITIAREYGSGGSDIGRRVAELLGWECLDKQIIERVAALGQVDPDWAAKADEHALDWWERVLRSFRQGGPDSFAGHSSTLGIDKDTMQQLTQRVIGEAARAGNCVIIGRSASCVLYRDPHVLRVHVYAPLVEKLERMKVRHPGERDLAGLLRRIDTERAHYMQSYYGCEPENHLLYHLSLNSTLGIETCARLIETTIRSS